MTGIDESLERARTAVRILRRVRIRAIVSPVARAGKLRDRKQLDRGNAEVAQRVEARNDRVERPLRRERAGMQLIDDVVFERDAAPSRVVPFEIARDHFRRRVDAVRLMPRRGIGTLVAVRESVEIARAFTAIIDDHFVIARGRRLHGDALLVDEQLDTLVIRSPHAKLATVAIEHACAERDAVRREPMLAGAGGRRKRFASGDGAHCFFFVVARLFFPEPEPEPEPAPAPGAGARRSRCAPAPTPGSGSGAGAGAGASGRRNTAPNGGNVIVTDHLRPCNGIGAASRPPMFPCPLPPYSVASLLRTSRQWPPCGMPIW